MLLKAAAVWLIILVCAVLNGAFREAVLLPNWGKPAAFAASGVLLCALIVGVAVVTIHWLGPGHARQALGIGLFWLCLTLAFEFGFGRFVQHREWLELLAAYTFRDGNLWPVVLAVTFLAPLIAWRLRT